MIKMSYDKFEEICEKMDELPNIIDNNKGLTEHDLEIIQTKIAKDYPDKAVLMLMTIFFQTKMRFRQVN